VSADAPRASLSSAAIPATSRVRRDRPRWVRFGITLLPIGAYEPRWFMKPAHMNPEEAVRAYTELGGRGLFVGMHWGTFRLTDEPPLEPPRAHAPPGPSAAAAERLWVPRHGETRIIPLSR
jgi:N-acyl-phosphatidylethanolamine-hydrolysing phospholipase D